MTQVKRLAESFLYPLQGGLPRDRSRHFRRVFLFGSSKTELTWELGPWALPGCCAPPEYFDVGTLSGGCASQTKPCRASIIKMTSEG
jgi:hypothetical protein